MTVAEFIRGELSQLPQDLELVIQHRVKTGFDTGEVYVSKGFVVAEYRGQAIISCQDYTLTGGW